MGVNYDTVDPLPDPVKLRPRVSASLRLHYQDHLSEADSFEGSWARECDTVGECVEPYNRKTVVEDSWAPLDFGPLDPDEVGEVIVENLTSKFYPVNPSPEVKEADSLKVLQLAPVGTLEIIPVEPLGCVLIPPTGSQLILPRNPSEWLIRSPRGLKIVARVYVYPR